MKYVMMVFALTLIVLFVQCRKSKKGTAAKTTAEKEISPVSKDSLQPVNESILPIRIQKDFRIGENDQFNVVEMKCISDTLEVTVEYGGGCEDHSFEMVSNNAWLKSLPVQLNLYLIHESNNDMCRALLRQTLRFNLNECRFPGGNEMRIFINNDRSIEALYKY